MTTPSRDTYSSILRKGTEWDEVRSVVLPQLIGILSTRFHEYWIEVGILFKDTLPDGTKPRSFSVGFWKKQDQQIQGTLLYEDKGEARGWSGTSLVASGTFRLVEGQLERQLTILLLLTRQPAFFLQSRNQ